MKWGDAYLITCKQAYYKGITPADPHSKTTKEYSDLINFSDNFIKEHSFEYFASYMMEGQYFIQLWTAHILLEYHITAITPDLKMRCLEEIWKYAKESMNEKVAHEESAWLTKHNY